MKEQSLYERLGGVYAIAAVVDHFSDQLLKNSKIVNANPQILWIMNSMLRTYFLPTSNALDRC